MDGHQRAHANGDNNVVPNGTITIASSPSQMPTNSREESQDDGNFGGRRGRDPTRPHE